MFGCTIIATKLSLASMYLYPSICVLPMFPSNKKVVSHILHRACRIHKWKHSALWDCEPLYAIHHNDLFAYSLDS